MTKILVIPDVHVPFHDKKAWNLTLNVIEKAKPDKVVIIGDFADFLAVSFFPKPPGRLNNLELEVEDVNEELDKLPKGTVYMKGNHEHRLERYLAQKAPELFGLVECSRLFKIRERGWTMVEYMDHYILGKVLFAHDLGHAGKHAALNTLGAAGMCTVFGHTHRGGVHYGGTVNGEHRFALNVGWLGDYKKIDYVHRAKTRDWQHGFGWINMDDKGLAWATFVPIVNGKCVVDGREYR